jgi:hypothetical protein
MVKCIECRELPTLLVGEFRKIFFYVLHNYLTVRWKQPCFTSYLM